MGVVRLSQLADGDLDAIRAYIEHDNPRAANNLLEKIFVTLETLADNPELGERREDLGKDLRVFVVRPYVIVYHSAVDGIHVARIIHGARELPAMFR